MPLPQRHDIIAIIRDTRSLSLPHFGTVAYTEKDASGANFVTEMDVRIEKYLRSALREVAPDIPFVGEETGGDETAHTYWLCDPIDGTDAYIRGLPFATTMLALIVDGAVHMSFIYDFAHDIMYSAERNHGAFKEDQRIHVSTREARTSLMMISSRDKDIVHAFIKDYNYIHSATSGFKFAMLAQGSLDAVITINGHGKSHDRAPGSLLATEAGAIISNFTEDSFDFRKPHYICATKEFYPTLLKTYKSLNLSL